MSEYGKVSVVIPYFQRKPGLLANSLNSIINQTYPGEIVTIVVDDESPYPAEKEISDIVTSESRQIILLNRKNGGAGAARNKALSKVTSGTKYVAFLDSDDCWKSGHLENAISALAKGYDVYFSDWWSFNYPDTTNFERIGTLSIEAKVAVEGGDSQLFELGMTPIEHILSDGGGVIQTSTVVYDFSKFSNLRFREEFYNGQDFFFWMDLGELGANFVFSTELGCDNGEGINIYQGAGWGSDRSMQRLRNELFVWLSVEKIYSLSEELYKLNRRTIHNLQKGVVRDFIHRIVNRKPVSSKLLWDVFKMAPSTLWQFLAEPIAIVRERLR